MKAWDLLLPRTKLKVTCPSCLHRWTLTVAWSGKLHTWRAKVWGGSAGSPVGRESVAKSTPPPSGDVEGPRARIEEKGAD